MSSLGMEQHETPVFELGEDETGGPCFFWTNPWNGRRDIIAKLFWPGHPVEATEAVEQLFSELELRRKPDAAALSHPTPSPQSDDVRAAFETCSDEARRYASHYSEASDGRNTFTLLAEWCDRQAALSHPRPALSGGLKATAEAIARDIAELPDRTSPEDAPEMMLVTHDELISAIISRLDGEVGR